jgi:hypothetical protein
MGGTGGAGRTAGTGVVVVGAGKAGSLHYRAYSRLARSGLLARERVQFVDHAGAPGPDLAALLRRDGYRAPVVTGRDRLAPHPVEATIVDLCLPSRSLAAVLVEWWRAGYRKFVVEKPFTIPPESADAVREVLAGSQVVLVRNYLHSRVHETVREFMALFALEPVLCLTNFSKDRRADNLRRRGASPTASPTVFEVEMPHQLYIGADLLGPTQSVRHVEDRDTTTAQGEVLRLGEGLIVGRAERGASFVHYSNLHHPTIVRSLDLICRGALSVHAAYAPICEELSDIKAGVMLCRGSTVLSKKLFTHDDNMLGMISSAFTTLSTGIGGKADFEEVLRASAIITSAVEGTPDTGREAVSAGSDVLQEWVVDSFTSGLGSGAGLAFLNYLERRQRTRLAGVMPALDPAFGTLGRGRSRETLV